MTGELAGEFERHRRHLVRVAYATLGSLADAEDVVQESWLRLERQPDPGAIADLRAWLTTVVGRLALDLLGSARARREQYVGPWLPEPLVAFGSASRLPGGGGEPDPAELAALDESVSWALMVVLERLSPAERTAFLLHDVFELRFEEIASVVGTTEPAARQLASRARRRVAEGRPRLSPSREEQRRIVEAFAAACTDGDLQGLVAMLHPDAVWRTDGGGHVRAARRVHHGANKIARGMIALTRRRPQSARLVDINGVAGILAGDGQGVPSVISLTVDGGLIVAVDIVRNPAKLSTVPPAW